MRGAQELLLDIWREACRHIELDESIVSLAEILVRHVPLDRVWIGQITDEPPAIDIVASGLSSKLHSNRSLPRVDVAPGRARRLKSWLRAGELVHLTRQESAPREFTELASILPDGEHLLLPLRNREGFPALLILSIRPRETFTDAHKSLAELLIEPFTAAFENDHRLREVNELREAAEAEKRALLSRLGRESLDDEIVGAQRGLKHVMERIALVAHSDAQVLILGETGSGKEVVARAIHHQSKRDKGPFIRVNCGAIPSELIDSELFGHEKGAFTGAASTREGWFERADGGTLFLDEIGELPAAAQVRLLRVLQDGIVERVGARQPIKVDVRIVSATHRDLAAMVAEGDFREDLWYRIAVFPIILPPLRERGEDIPDLARHFAHRAATRFGLPFRDPAADDIALLQAYSWPGNVRELAAVIDRAAILGDGQRLEIRRALGDTSTVGDSKSHSYGLANGVNGGVPSTRGGSTIQPLDDAMRNHIQRALEATDGRIEGPHGA
ncbi:MAG: sigma-54-dependent Fis family transcriptional regulator, partial [Phycisphaerales bacterium]